MTSKQVLQIILSILFIALFAQLTINVPVNQNNIPITGQTFAVLVVAYYLGKKNGTLSVLFYILIGLLGFPIFADGRVGWQTLIGGSGGFLIGFIFSAYVVGGLGEKNWNKDFGKSLVAMTFGTAIILIFGLSRLAYLYGLEKGLEYGFYPFWKGAIVKILLGAMVLPLYFRFKEASFFTKFVL